MSKLSIYEKIYNAIYPSKEDDGIEHVDMSYEEFIDLIKELADMRD